jgi:hypothetical protein
MPTEVRRTDRQIQGTHARDRIQQTELGMLTAQHAFGSTTDIMDVSQTEKKGPLMNTIEHVHIHTLSMRNSHRNHTYNPIFSLTEDYVALSKSFLNLNFGRERS